MDEGRGIYSVAMFHNVRRSQHRSVSASRRKLHDAGFFNI